MKVKFKLALFLLAVLSMVSMVLVINSRPAAVGTVMKSALITPAVNTSSKDAVITPVIFESAASAAVPAVVHIKTIIRQHQPQYQQQEDNDPFGNRPGLNDEFSQEQQQQGDQMASGSGVIIKPDGYIVTNNHVVEGASQLSVTLSNNKVYPATVIGTDPNTDLALIKIEADNLPVIKVGNSDEVKLGQGVLAIGYPLNLDVTVTQGIVSAKSRNIGINRQAESPIEAYIQTDAAVNPGSSGGALVNINGELVGINSAIASPTGSFAGYAYAVPSNIMVKVIGDILKYGSVKRAYLGVSLAPENLDQSKKQALGIGETSSGGVWVLDLNPAGAAIEAGIEKGDVITFINNIAVNTSTELIEQIAKKTPGDRIDITLIRGNEKKTLNVTLK